MLFGSHSVKIYEQSNLPKASMLRSHPLHSCAGVRELLSHAQYKVR